MDARLLHHRAPAADVAPGVGRIVENLMHRGVPRVQRDSPLVLDTAPLPHHRRCGHTILVQLARDASDGYASQKPGVDLTDDGGGLEVWQIATLGSPALF